MTTAVKGIRETFIQGGKKKKQCDLFVHDGGEDDDNSGDDGSGIGFDYLQQ